MIMSGSEASVVDDYPWERPLAKALRDFIQAKKPVLGICYSHQFIAKELLGRSRVRHSPTPEFGYRKIDFKANPLFAGIRKPLISAVTHFDEVLDLGDDFTVLASTPDCAVQAFQIKDLPVWGVQFHPEYGPGSIEEIFAAEEASYPDFQKRYFDDRKGDSDLEQNQKIFFNFLSS
jgi:GMP synthase (glutamine-hydrolysing)